MDKLKGKTLIFFDLSVITVYFKQCLIPWLSRLLLGKMYTKELTSVI